MLTFRKELLHSFQEGAPNCGPIALQCVFSNPLSEIEQIVKCTSKGTRTENVVEGLRANGVSCEHIRLRADGQTHLWWLETCSLRWPIYLACDFVNQGKRGRPSHGHHAVLFANGMCYDGHAHREEPIGAIALKFNKQLIINDLVIIEHELPNWRKNMECA